MSVRPGLKALTRTPFACVGSGEPGAGEHERGLGGTACEVRDGCDFATGADDVDHHRVVATFVHAFDQRVDDVNGGEELGLHSVVPRSCGEIVCGMRVAAPTLLTSTSTVPNSRAQRMKKSRVS